MFPQKFKRPQLNIPLSTFDKTIEITALLLILGHFIFVAMMYSGLPEIIPTHFNASGKADGFGEKIGFWAMPIINIFLSLFLFFFNKRPDLMNYPIPITEENAQKQYQNMSMMMRILNLSITLVFIMISYFTVKVAHDHHPQIGSVFLLLPLLIIMSPVLYFTIKSFNFK